MKLLKNIIIVKVATTIKLKNLHNKKIRKPIKIQTHINHDNNNVKNKRYEDVITNNTNTNKSDDINYIIKI